MIKGSLPASPPPATEPAADKVLLLPQALTVFQLAERLGISPVQVIKALMKSGIMATINQVIDFDVAAGVAGALEFQVSAEAVRQAVRPGRAPTDSGEALGLKPRAPVVTILGHVDHGKTTILDAIRQTEVAATEAGAITQHIGAYQVETEGHKITFLDTPGHEAFTAMRARGARVTDIAVLVVAADDGVMPQTEEAIDHARAAGVPIVVAINKIDKPEADPERVKRQLAERGLLIEEWGGDVVCTLVSAKRKQGLEALLENILVVAEVADLKANPEAPAKGVVIEARLDPSQGPTATVLIQDGTLKIGDIVVAGQTWGKVKAMFDDRGRRQHRAEPSDPVEVLGLNQAPQAGDLLEVAREERSARALLQQRPREAPHPVSLREVSHQAAQGRVTLPIILKVDVQGSIEPIRTSLERLATDQLQVRILHAASGSINESDVLLATASQGIIIGFNARPDPGAQRLADAQGVEVRLYDIIYRLVEDVQKALHGLLEPVIEEVVLGRAEVKALFPTGHRGKVAGLLVTQGLIARGSHVRVVRKDQVLHEGTITSLKRFKEDVREVAAGFECGLGVEGFSDFQPGDLLEAFTKERR